MAMIITTTVTEKDNKRRSTAKLSIAKECTYVYISIRTLYIKQNRMWPKKPTTKVRPCSLAASFYDVMAKFSPMRKMMLIMVIIMATTVNEILYEKFIYETLIITTII